MIRFILLALVSVLLAGCPATPPPPTVRSAILTPDDPPECTLAGLPAIPALDQVNGVGPDDAARDRRAVKDAYKEAVARLTICVAAKKASNAVLQAKPIKH